MNDLNLARRSRVLLPLLLSTAIGQAYAVTTNPIGAPGSAGAPGTALSPAGGAGGNGADQSDNASVGADVQNISRPVGGGSNKRALTLNVRGGAGGSSDTGLGGTGGAASSVFNDLDTDAAVGTQ